MSNFTFAIVVLYTAAITSTVFGASISTIAMWYLISGQLGGGLVTVNAIMGVLFLLGGAFIAKVAGTNDTQKDRCAECDCANGGDECNWINSKE